MKLRYLYVISYYLLSEFLYKATAPWMDALGACHRCGAASLARCSRCHVAYCGPDWVFRKISCFGFQRQCGRSASGPIGRITS